MERLVEAYAVDRAHPPSDAGVNQADRADADRQQRAGGEAPPGSVQPATLDRQVGDRHRALHPAFAADDSLDFDAVSRRPSPILHLTFPFDPSLTFSQASVK
jgi:hypothetical protein